MKRLSCFALLLVAACGSDRPGQTPEDVDEDGIDDSVTQDCTPFAIYPDQDDDSVGADAGALQACRLYDHWVDVGGDCDDLDAAIGRATTYFADTDGDGLGDPAAPVLSCIAPDDAVTNADDQAPNCAGVEDECGVCDGPGPQTWYADVDGDGRGDDRVTLVSCDAPVGFVGVGGDPLPECASDHLDCAGTCGGDAVDDECDVCNGPGAPTWYPDADDDGLGDERESQTSCNRPDGWVDLPGDPEPECATDDTDACGICGGPGLGLYFADVDGDGLGDRNDVGTGCGVPIGYVENSDDPEPLCATNDSDSCGVCAGPGPSVVYADVDGDRVGDERAAIEACGVPDGFSAVAGDPEPECATDNTDGCGICNGGDSDMDCLGVCFGEAYLDGCEVCVGGVSGLEPVALDTDGDGFPDVCDRCEGADLDRFVVQWDAIAPFAGAGGPYTFQVILYSNGEFRFQYGELDHFLASATVGYQTAAGETALELGMGSLFPTDHPVVHFRGLDDGAVAVEYTPPMSWLNIAPVGTPHELPDDGTVSVPIGFDFQFFGEPYSELQISSNGFLSLSEPVPGYQNTNFPNADTGAMLAPLWDDLNPTRYGAIYSMLVPGGCTMDCNGQFGGVAAIDLCGDCAGGDTGLAMESGHDCAGVCHGEAELDICEVCYGGTTGVEPSSPEDCPFGIDLVVDESYLGATMSIDYIEVPEDSCLIDERCVRGTGTRKVLRFGTRIANVGNTDLRLGVPPSAGTSTEFWTWDDCHGHHHYEDYAAYDLVDVESGELLPIGAKTGFCVMDIGVYDTSITDRCEGYNCGNQGISAGCQDTYSPSLQCQWIDITDVDDGVYDVVVTTNPIGAIEELDHENNSAAVRVEITGDEVEVDHEH